MPGTTRDESRKPSQTYAFLMTDVVGSTPLWNNDPATAERIMTRLDVIASRVTEEWEGKLVRERGEGDSHFFVFHLASNAVRAAVSLCQQISSDPVTSQIQLRTAVNAGEASFRSGDYDGPVVNLCARLRGAANPGQILTTAVVSLLLNPEERSRLLCLGAFFFKGFRTEIEVFQVLADGLPCHFPTIQAKSKGTGGLPLYLSTFVGRNSEIGALRKLVRERRLTTIVGPGGVGKSRLAVETALLESDHFQLDSVFVDLADAWTLQDVVSAVGAAIGGGADGLDSVVETLGNSSRLLIFDNCEQATDHCAAVAKTLLARCSNLAILATSRKPLGILGEETLYLDGLESPLVTDPAKAEESEAVLLFLERSADRKFKSKNPVDIATVAALCQKLDGLPLAIEIVAGATDLFTAAEITGYLSEFLDRELADASPKPYSPTLAATVNWSRSLLTEGANLLLSQLTLFPSSWSLRSAVAVCGGNNKTATEISELVQELLTMSLIAPADGPLDHKRFRLLQTTAQVVDRNGAFRPPELIKSFIWHLKEVAIEANFMLLQGQEESSFAAFERDYASISIALQLSFVHDVESCLEIAESLRAYWFRSARFPDGEEWYRKLKQSAGLADESLAAALSGFSSFRIRSADYAEAEFALDAAETLLRDQKGKEWARVIGNRASVWQKRGENAKAKVAFQECVDEFKRIGDLNGIALNLINLGVTKMRLGDPLDESISLYLESLAVAKELGSESMIGNAFSSLAEASGLKQDYYGALGYCREAFQHYQHGAWLVQLAWTLVNLANLLFQVGDFKGATVGWHGAKRMEALAKTGLSPRQVEILARIEPKIVETIGPARWRDVQKEMENFDSAKVVEAALRAIDQTLNS